MKKNSVFNIWQENILYNSFSDIAIEFDSKETNDIKYYLTNLNEFEEHYPDIFQYFIQCHFIVDEKFDEINYLLFKNKETILSERNYHLTINPTLQCNYRCWYCCVEEMNTKYEKRRMDNSTIQKIKNHILKIVKNGVNSLHIDWFGGEPLMYFNEVILPISTHAIELCKRHRLPFINQITTNGYYFNDEIIKACNTINLNKFQIPIDGNETRHNMVKNIKGEGHFKKIIDNVNYICESIENSMVVLRINYDTDTLSDISEIIDFFPVKNRKSIFVDFQRIWQVGLSKDPISGENETLLQRKRDFEEAGFQVEYFAYRHRGFSACYSDNYYHRVINYDGKIYKCAARDYDDSLVIGRLCSDGDLILDDNVMSTYFGKTTFDNEKCLNCKILPLCYGPCVQHHYEIQKGKHDFVCRNDYSEISFQRYIRSKVTKK